MLLYLQTHNTFKMKWIMTNYLNNNNVKHLNRQDIQPTMKIIMQLLAKRKALIHTDKNHEFKTTKKVINTLNILKEEITHDS